MSAACDRQTAIERRSNQIRLLARAMGKAMKKNRLSLAQKHAEAIRDLSKLNQQEAPNFAARRQSRPEYSYVMGGLR